MDQIILDVIADRSEILKAFLESKASSSVIGINPKGYGEYQTHRKNSDLKATDYIH